MQTVWRRVEREPLAATKEVETHTHTQHEDAKDRKENIATRGVRSQFLVSLPVLGPRLRREPPAAAAALSSRRTSKRARVRYSYTYTQAHSPLYARREQAQAT